MRQLIRAAAAPAGVGVVYDIASAQVSDGIKNLAQNKQDAELFGVKVEGVGAVDLEVSKCQNVAGLGYGTALPL